MIFLCLEWGFWRRRNDRFWYFYHFSVIRGKECSLIKVNYSLPFFSEVFEVDKVAKGKRLVYCEAKRISYCDETPSNYDSNYGAEPW